MGKHRKIYVALLASIVMMSQIAAQSATAAFAQSGTVSKNTNASGVTTGSLSSIQLGSGIKVTLEEVQYFPQAEGNIVSFTLNFYNGGSSNANLMNYFSKVVTPGGSIILGHPVNGDALKNTLVSKQSRRVTYYANIAQVGSLKGLKIPIYAWDVSAKGYMKQIGAFKLPANYTGAVSSGKSLNTIIDDIPVTAGAQSLEIYKYNGKVYAKVGFNLTNRGNKVLGDPEYQAYLVSTGGSRFKLTLSSSQQGYQIQPQEKKTIFYVTEIPPYLNTDHMMLQFTQKDEGLNLEFGKFSFLLPDASVPDLVVGEGASKKIIVHNNAIEFSLQNASVFAENEKGQWSFQLKVKNTGNKAVTLPTYELAVRSATGKAFPVDAKGLSGLKLKPLEEKVIPLSAQIPLEVEQNTLQLEMIEAAGKESAGEAGSTGTSSESGNKDDGAEAGGKLNIPVAYFTIPYTLRTDSHKDVIYHTENQYGKFAYSVESLQRFPWKDEDIVIAKLTLTNTQSVSLPLPDLKAALKMDQDDFSSSSELFMDQEVKSLAPGKSVKVNVFAKVPYTLDFNTLHVELYSTGTGENEKKEDFLTFSTPGTANALDSIKQGESYEISGKGKHAKARENKTTVYEGSSSNIVSTEMILSSEEMRQSKMAQLEAYYRTSDGQLFEAVSIQPETIATPGFDQLVVFRARLPKSVSTSDLELYIGQGIKGNTLSEPGEEPTGFVNVSSMKLRPLKNSSRSSLSDVSVLPYKFSVLRSSGSKMKGSDSISITINYDLLRDNVYDMGEMEHKLMLRFTDPYGQSQDKALDIGKDLTEGNNQSFTLTFSNDVYKDLTSGGYRFTLYEEMLGERIELASQSYYMYSKESK